MTVCFSCICLGSQTLTQSMQLLWISYPAYLLRSPTLPDELYFQIWNLMPVNKVLIRSKNRMIICCLNIYVTNSDINSIYKVTICRIDASPFRYSIIAPLMCINPIWNEDYLGGVSKTGTDDRPHNSGLVTFCHFRSCKAR